MIGHQSTQLRAVQLCVASSADVAASSARRHFWKLQDLPLNVSTGLMLETEISTAAAMLLDAASIWNVQQLDWSVLPDAVALISVVTCSGYVAQCCESAAAKLISAALIWRLEIGLSSAATASTVAGPQPQRLKICSS
jgi:hypothetical protein